MRKLLLLLTLLLASCSLPQEKAKTTYDRFIEYYGDMYYTFIKQNTEHTIVDDFISVTHAELKERQGDPDHYFHAFFKTEVVYEVDLEYYSLSILNEYVHDAGYEYQNVVSWRI